MDSHINDSNVLVSAKITLKVHICKMRDEKYQKNTMRLENNRESSKYITRLNSITAGKRNTLIIKATIKLSIKVADAPM